MTAADTQFYLDTKAAMIASAKEAAAEQEATRKKQAHSSTFKAPVVSITKPVVST